MMRYGATLSEMKTGTVSSPSKEELERSIARLSKPKMTAKKFSYAAHASDDGVKGSDLFPSRGEVEEVADIPCDSVYPEDWRKLPRPKATTSSKDTSSQSPFRDPSTDDLQQQSSIAADGVQWLYLIITLSMKATNSAKAQQDARSQVERLLRQHKAVPHNNSTKQEIRQVVREGRSFVVLVDIVATRRSIMSGIPHDVAAAIYKFLDEFYPISVKFGFVGISDNATKLAARDVFIAGVLPLSKRLPFSAIDSEHLFVAHVKSDEADVMRLRGLEERRRKEEEASRRRSTPKYVPPAEPEWLQRLRQQQSLNRTPSPALNGSTMAALEMPTCSRCWAHSRSTEAVPSRQQPLTPVDQSNVTHGDADDSAVTMPLEREEVTRTSNEKACAPRVTAESVARILAEKKRSSRGNEVSPATELLKVAQRVSSHIRETL